MSAFGAKRTSRERREGADPTRMTDTVEKGFWGRSLSNIDSRSNATAQSRFKNPFVRIRLHARSERTRSTRLMAVIALIAIGL